MFIILAVLKQANNPNAYLVAGIAWTILFVIAIAISTFGTGTPITDEFIEEHTNQPKVKISDFIKNSIHEYVRPSITRHSAPILRCTCCPHRQRFVFHLATDFHCVLHYRCRRKLALDAQALSIVGIPVTIVATKLMVVKGPRFIFRLSYISIIAAMVVYIAVTC
ncbi:MAG: hypothetical protein ACLT4Y_10280 [Bifidobacterium breve]